MNFRQLAWDAYFAGLASISHHPGASRENHVQRTIAKCAEMADEMLAERDKRFGKGSDDE